MGILRGLVRVVAAVTWAAVPTGGAAGQAWPVRPVTMVIPFGAGSGIDVLGRVLAPAMAAKLGQPIVIENIGGAGGMTGAARVAKAAPDGYTFVLGCEKMNDPHAEEPPKSGRAGVWRIHRTALQPAARGQEPRGWWPMERNDGIGAHVMLR